MGRAGRLEAGAAGRAVEQVVSMAQSAALLWGSRKVEVPSPPSGACGARFRGEVETEHPPGAGLAGAEGVWCHQSQAGSPLGSSHHSFAISHTSCQKQADTERGILL